MSAYFLTPEGLAQRWHLMPSTLHQWRWNGKGPTFTKIGGKVRYSLKDIELYKRQQRHRHTSGPLEFEENA